MIPAPHPRAAGAARLRAVGRARARAAGLVLAAALFAAPAAAETLRVVIDLGDQQMSVRRDGAEVQLWPVSTARAGKCTPTGEFTPYLLKRMHYSSLYDNAPMPFSIFFYGNYAIHGTTAVDKLGTPASAGCVRLHPDNAEWLYEAVREVGMDETVIEIRE